MKINGDETKMEGLENEVTEFKSVELEPKAKEKKFTAPKYIKKGKKDATSKDESKIEHDDNSEDEIIDEVSSDDASKITSKDLEVSEKKPGIMDVIKKHKKAVSFVFLGLAVVCLIIAIISGIMTISNWWSYRSMSKDIEAKYDSSLMENKVYTQINVLTANVQDYINGECITDLGTVACEKPEGTVILVFYDLNNELKPLESIYDNPNSSIEYVTQNFEVPDNAMVVFSNSAKGEYLDYLSDLDDANKQHAKMESSKSSIIGFAITAVVFGIVFFVTGNSTNGFNMENIEKSRSIKKNKDTDKVE